MPSLETPPNSAPPTQPVKVRTGRFGELEEHELIHLLDSLDDERSKARFRESIYISFIIYLGIAWFLFYGPRILFHQPRLISPVDVLKERDRQLTFLDTPKNLSSPIPKASKALPEKNHARPLDQKTLQQLQAMRKAEAPAPAPAQPAPQQAAPTPPAPQPPPPAPQPTQQALIEAPKPAPTRPNFGSPNQSPGDAIRKAAQDAAQNRGGGDYAPGPSGGQGGMAGTAEILSDTQGVDFGPYIQRILRDIKRNWIPLIPEEARPPLNKQGETLIRFTISSDGHITAMNLDGSSQDTAIDRACWGGITGVGQFPPLPANFKGPNLELRVDFFTNKPLP
jgi:outer membrane biosynthesis protein TonB